MFTKSQGQLRTAGLGSVVGLDMTAALGVAAALGFDCHAVALLLPFAESGLVAAYGQKQDNDNGE